MHYKSISIEECYSILFYHPKKLLYQLYHTILQYTLHPKTLLFYFFIKILFFLIFFYYFFHIITFFQLRGRIKYIYIYIAYCYSTILSLELYCSTIAKIFAIVRYTIFWCKCFLTMKCQKGLRYDISILQC